MSTLPAWFPMVLDGMVLGALAGAVLYGMSLEKRLRQFRRDKEEMHNLAASFLSATDQAQAGLTALHNAMHQGEKILSPMLKQANSVADDLQFLIERGEKLGGSLEKVVRQASVVAAAPTPVPPPLPTPVMSTIPPLPSPRKRSSKAEEALRAALNQG